VAQSITASALEVATSRTDGVMAWCAIGLDATESPAQIQTTAASKTANTLLPGRITVTPCHRLSDQRCIS